MKLLPFKTSAAVSLGVELEFQLINPVSYGLISRAKGIMRNIEESLFQENIKPEVTQSMIELNSAITQSPHELLHNLNEMHAFLSNEAQSIGILICGGGTHPFQKWSTQKIYPTLRFKNLAQQYRYLAKHSTVFGQHIHIGCTNGEEALYLTHALIHYVPHFIAISASSPFYQGVDTGYQSCRANIFSGFPQSGVIPYLLNWQEFSAYYYKMRQLKIITSMKDFYWDIRPKPEFGTVEIRVCDTPLTIKKAVIIAAYIQTLAHYLLQNRPIAITHDLYYLHGFNRFQAMRYGYDGRFINPSNFQHSLIGNDILETIKTIENSTHYLKNSDWIADLKELIINKQNDTETLRHIFKDVKSLPKMVAEQCVMWEQT